MDRQQQREILLRRLAAVSSGHGQHAPAEFQQAQADKARDRAREPVPMIEFRDGGA